MGEMAPDVIEGLVVVAGVLVASACYRAWTAQTAHLNLSLFRPYRGDPWPIGVQEDDDFRFNWKRDGATPSPAEEASETLAGTYGGPADMAQPILIEATTGGPVVVERIGTISVRGGGR